MSMKSAKIQCNRVIAQAKKYHWTEFCKSEVLESKDMYKVWEISYRSEKLVQVRSVSYQIR